MESRSKQNLIEGAGKSAQCSAYNQEFRLLFEEDLCSAGIPIEANPIAFVVNKHEKKNQAELSPDQLAV